MPSLVLLDAQVAAGLLSKIVLPGNSSAQQKTERWWQSVSRLISKLGTPEVVVPTPVFYECARASVEFFRAFNVIQKDVEARKPVSLIFHYANHSITPRILTAATKFLMHYKDIGWFDALLAVYCLEENHHLVTMNSKHFPEKFFTCKAIELAPIPTERSDRAVVYLLEPRADVWRAEDK